MNITFNIKYKKVEDGVNIIILFDSDSFELELSQTIREYNPDSITAAIMMLCSKLEVKRQNGLCNGFSINSADVNALEARLHETNNLILKDVINKYQEL